MSLLFKPFGILSGALAGMIATKIFNRAWSLIDDQGAPAPNHRGVGLAKLAAALALQGAVSQLVRGLADHGTRHGFSALTGEWPD
jgi:hypothetical protein